MGNLSTGGVGGNLSQVPPFHRIYLAPTILQWNCSWQFFCNFLTWLMRLPDFVVDITPRNGEQVRAVKWSIGCYNWLISSNVSYHVNIHQYSIPFNCTHPLLSTNICTSDWWLGKIKMLSANWDRPSLLPAGMLRLSHHTKTTLEITWFWICDRPLKNANETWENAAFLWLRKIRWRRNDCSVSRMNCRNILNLRN